MPVNICNKRWLHSILNSKGNTSPPLGFFGVQISIAYFYTFYSNWLLYKLIEKYDTNSWTSSYISVNIFLNFNFCFSLFNWYLVKGQLDLSQTSDFCDCNFHFHHINGNYLSYAPFYLFFKLQSLSGDFGVLGHILLLFSISY